jgi:hypothetical protein
MVFLQKIVLYIRNKILESNESYKALYSISVPLPRELEKCKNIMKTIFYA